MKARLLEIMAASLAMGGAFPDVKISAKDKRVMKDKRPNTPPRSMTTEELAYYKKHKSLNGFNPSLLTPKP